MKVEADFSQISTNFEPLEDKTEYRFKLIEINDQAQDEEWKAKNATSGKNPALVFISEVVEGERAGTLVQDYIYTKTKDGKVNKRGLGQIKLYTEAILGAQKAAGSAIDTDELINGEFLGTMKAESYMKDNPDGSGTKVPAKSVKLDKIRAVS